MKDGLLLYNGRYNEMHDFIALEIVRGQVQFSFSLGGAGDVTRLATRVDGGVADGQFHEVYISYVNRVSDAIFCLQRVVSVTRQTTHLAESPCQLKGCQFCSHCHYGYSRASHKCCSITSATFLQSSKCT